MPGGVPQCELHREGLGPQRGWGHSTTKGDRLLIAGTGAAVRMSFKFASGQTRGVFASNIYYPESACFAQISCKKTPVSYVYSK